MFKWIKLIKWIRNHRKEGYTIYVGKWIQTFNLIILENQER